MTIRVAVCESTSFWTANLERAFHQSQQITFRWFSSLKDLLQNFDGDAFQLAIVDAVQIEQSLLSDLYHISQLTDLVAITGNNDTQVEDQLRELGFCAVFVVDGEHARVAKGLKKLLAAREQSRQLM